MNKQNLKTLIAHLEDLPPEAPDFDMKWIIHRCGTSACIAGHAAFLTGEIPDLTADRTGGTSHTSFCLEHEAALVAIEYLGLTKEEAAALFYPVNLEFYDVDDAVTTLKYFLETGEVTWTEPTSTISSPT